MTTGSRRTRVLHLVDQLPTAIGADRPMDPDAALLCCAGLIRRLPEFEQSVCLVGGSRLEERAAGVGLPATDRIAPPLGLAARAIAGLRAFLQDRGEPEVVQCWSPSTLALAAAASTAPVCGVMLGQPRSPGWGASRVRVRRARLVVFRHADAWSEVLGVHPGSIAMSPLPRADGAAAPAARVEARDRLGVSEGEVVLTIIGGAPGEVDALRMVFVMGLIYEAGGRAVWVVPASSARLARSLRFHANSAWPSRMIITDRAFGEQVAGADVGFWLGAPSADGSGEGPSPAGAMLISAALDAGVPVIAPRSPLTDAMYSEAAGGACLAFNSANAEIARKLLPLVLDRSRLADARRVVGAGTPRPPGPPFERVVAEQWTACRVSRSNAYALRP